MLNRRWMLLSLALASLMFVSPASAQSHSVVSADSNLSSTELTVEFSGLQSSSTYELLYVPEGQDFEELKTFSTTGGGAASVEFRHAPFTRNQDYLGTGDEGWLYRVESPPDQSVPDSQYSFTVLHGNMLTLLDTFDDNSLNNDLYSVETVQAGFVDESNSQLELIAQQNDDDEVILTLDQNVTGSEVFIAEISEVESGGGSIQQVRVGGNTFSLSAGTNGTLKSYIASDDDLVLKYNDQVERYDYPQDSFSVEFRVYTEFASPAIIRVSSLSKAPVISKAAWVDPNIFNPAEEDLIFGNVVSPDAADSGLEYSADGISWSFTPPSGLNDNLFYRTTGAGTMDFTATETGQAFQNLDVTPITPQDNAVYPIPTSETLPVDFEYDVFYGEDVQSSVTWTLSNSTQELSSTIYPDLDAPIDRTFTESAAVPIGEYNWSVEVYDESLDASRTETFSFSVIDESNATVSFDLIAPSSGAEVDATDGVDFSYEVQADNSGTLNLWIPEESMTSPQFSETLGSGTTSRTVNLDVPSGSDLSWYLTFEEDSTGNVYTSQSVQFSTAEEGTEPQPGDGDGFQISIPDLFFNAMSQFGFGETSAGYLVAILLILLLSTVGFVLGGTFGGSAGMSLALVLSAIVGFLPAWVVLVVVFLAGGVTAYYVGRAVSGGD